MSGEEWVTGAQEKGVTGRTESERQGKVKYRGLHRGLDLSREPPGALGALKPGNGRRASLCCCSRCVRSRLEGPGSRTPGADAAV